MFWEVLKFLITWKSDCISIFPFLLNMSYHVNNYENLKEKPVN